MPHIAASSLRLTNEKRSTREDAPCLVDAGFGSERLCGLLGLLSLRARHRNFGLRRLRLGRWLRRSLGGLAFNLGGLAELDELARHIPPQIGIGKRLFVPGIHGPLNVLGDRKAILVQGEPRVGLARRLLGQNDRDER
jgi:hypothetical protein